ncbi:hypothetical protein [Mesorhizobium sp. M0870]|uniref:DUF6894 family protein n=1 Tax=Mesorhizobium sp. M0870 TaxID=2957016 RepID=UPI00333C5E25
MRYFMNVRCRGRLIPDHEGDELASEAAVRGHALANARDLVFNTRMDTMRSWFDCSFEVTDESGTTVLVMPFSEVVEDRF